ncbi:unnamed protein product [Closterium sp. NIES-65]|nr:unnamed protein product [Closterium sp. NIES-65]CAI5969962.1 unnamed protein product [Closterium sp. NIES-65]CAI5993452.1 unnamed protein product [Closterium sp. NIES-65]
MERTSSWLVDSGASSHICSDRSLFSSLKKPNEEILVRFGGGETYKVLGVGTVVATLRSPTSETTIQLDNVLFLPSSVHNLLSVRALGAAGVAVSFPAAGRVVLTSDDVPIGEGYTRNNLFYLQLHHGSSAAPSIKPTACPASTTTSSYLWHRRFGHLNMQALSTLHRQQLVTALCTAFRRLSRPSIVISTHILLTTSSYTPFFLGPNLPSLSFPHHTFLHQPPPTIPKPARTSHIFSSSIVFQPSSALDAARLSPSILLSSLFASPSPLHDSLLPAIPFSSSRSFPFLLPQGLTIPFRTH